MAAHTTNNTKFLLDLVMLFLISVNAQAAQHKLSAQEALSIATDAYIYGYPLVTMEMTRRVTTNVVKASETRAPMGHFGHARKFIQAGFTDITTPNADTLYSFAWLDLSAGPYILYMPPIDNHYTVMQLLSGWTNVFASLGTRTIGHNGGYFAITGPSWHGGLPDNVQQLRSPTNLVWILGRTYCLGTTEDYAAVHAIQNHYKLTPLCEDDTPCDTCINTQVDTRTRVKTAIRDQVNALDAQTYFSMLAHLMSTNRPAPQDKKIISSIARIGIKPGKKFNISAFTPDIQRALNQAPKIGLKKIMASTKQATTVRHGWTFLEHAGTYGTRYLERAYVTFFGLGANLPEDALYPYTTVDSSGKQLTGEHAYTIHFAEGTIPPVRGFWSLTMYNDQFFFVPNQRNKYTINQRDNLQKNSDGSIDIYIQHASPGAAQESNWLPAPRGPFTLMLRLYWPEKAILDGSWMPPTVQRKEADK